MTEPVQSQWGVQRNSGRCRLCGDQIMSASVHDLVYCSCGAVGVDGGNQYLRRTWKDQYGTLADVFEDTSICRHLPEPQTRHPLALAGQLVMTPAMDTAQDTDAACVLCGQTPSAP